MPDRPLLLLDPPVDTVRQPGRPRPMPRPHFPGQVRQVGRFTQRFRRLQDLIAQENPVLNLQGDPTGIAPDRALVFEVAGTVDDFASQATRLGFRFLGEIDTEFDANEDFYFDGAETKPVGGTLYLVMPDIQAMQQMLSLWSKYEQGEEFVRGEGKWRSLFDQLNDIRPWGRSDRVTEGFQQHLQNWLASDDTTAFQFEIDLWFSDGADERQMARNSVFQTLASIGGELLHEATIAPIRYHGLLAQISRETAEGLLVEGGLADIDNIMFLNPRAMAAFENAGSLAEIDTSVGISSQPAVAAVLDGFPMSNHERLVGRITIEDFLNIEGQCPTSRRFHGTSMASLIIHGDLHLDDVPIDSQLLILPVMVPDSNAGDRERMVPDQLAVDIIYRAVRRIKVEVAGEPALGPNVVIINHSLADLNNPYTNSMSSWGRLLDYLSFNYRVLFIVSAGNYTHQVGMSECHRMRDFEDADQDTKTTMVIKAIAEDMRDRQLLSPAESLNPLTIGAWHSDNCPVRDMLGGLYDPLANQNGPSLISAVGLGHKRAVKPDFFYDGGRTLVRLIPSGDCYSLSPVVQSTQFSGQMVAAPSGAGELNKVSNTCGTSNAAALVTRQAIQLHEVLTELADEDPAMRVPLEYQAVMIKALLAHGCAWNDLGETLDEIIEPTNGRQWHARRTNISRLLGVGRPDIERVKECTRQRATLLGWGLIEKDHSQNFVIPLPDSLSGQTEFRRMTVTTAWFSPVNPRHQQYRQAVLDTTVQATECGTARLSIQPPHNTITRGTLAHNIFEGERGVQFPNGISLVISCRQQAGTLDDPIPFAVVVSFEVGEDSNIDVYEEVRTKLAVQPRAAVQV